MIVLCWLKKPLFALKLTAIGKLLQLTSKQTGAFLTPPKFNKIYPEAPYQCQ